MASLLLLPRNHAQSLLLRIIISFLLFQLLSTQVTADNFTSILCMGNPNQTVVTNHRYSANVRALLENLVGNSYKSSFYNSSYGRPPNTAYGLYLCRGDASPKACQQCIRIASDQNSDACVNSSNEVLTYRDDCMMHYANFSIYGVYTKVGVDDAEFLLSSVKVQNPVVLNRTFVSMAKGLIREAAFVSDGMFATSRGRLGGEDGELYGLAQCTPDIGRANCGECLETAFSGIEKEKYRMDDTAVAALLTSCQLRYQNSSFSSTGATFDGVTGCCYISLVFFLFVMFLL